MTEWYFTILGPVLLSVDSPNNIISQHNILNHPDALLNDNFSMFVEL